MDGRVGTKRDPSQGVLNITRMTRLSRNTD